MEQNLLIAFDDSQNAMRAVEYVAKTFNPNNKITLFSVIPDTAVLCNMDSPELTPYFKAERGVFCTLEDKKRSLVEQALGKAKQLLLDAGFEQDKIVMKLETNKNGVARDIVNEANSGYDIVVLGRRGISGIKEFFLGSISQKVLNAAKEVSVLMVN
jgi:nucleotide-binding universal stress UspA family protein